MLKETIGAILVMICVVESHHRVKATLEHEKLVWDKDSSDVDTYLALVDVIRVRCVHHAAIIAFFSP